MRSVRTALALSPQGRSGQGVTGTKAARRLHSAACKLRTARTAMFAGVRGPRCRARSRQGLDGVGDGVPTGASRSEPAGPGRGRGFPGWRSLG